MSVFLFPCGSLSWTQTQTGTELCALYPSVENNNNNFILIKREGKHAGVSIQPKKLETFL